jgi:tetratricopeptide (TPR) repeat protein
MLKYDMQKRGVRFTLSFRRLKVGLLVPLLIAGLAAGCGGAEERESKYIERGKTLFEQGNLVKAEIEFKNALQINPKGTEARYHMGLIAEREGDLKKAYGAFRTVAAEQPDHFGAHLKLAQLYAIARQIEDAEQEAKIAGELKPNDPDLLSIQSMIAYARKDFAETRRLAEAALAENAKHEEARLLLAQALRAEGADDEALRQVDHAIDLIPETVAIRLLKASIHLERDQLDQVRTVYEELFKLKPDNHRYRASLAQIYISRGLKDEAEGVLRAAVDAGVGGDETKLNLIDLIAGAEGLEAAETQLQEFIAAEPDKHLFAFKLVSLYGQHDRAADAAAVLRKVIDQAGTEQAGLDARVALARLLISQGNDAAASDLVTEILNADSANPDGLMLRAAFSLNEGEIESAIADLRTLLRDRPDATPALKLLAQAQAARGDVELAMDTLKRVVDLDKTDIASRQRMAAHLAQTGNVPAALDLLDEILEIDPRSLPALQAKTEVLMAQRRWADAEATVKKVLEMPEHRPLGHTLYGRLYFAQGRYEDAVVAYEAAHRLAPTAGEPITGITTSYLAQEAPDKAAEFLETIVEKQSDNAVAHNLLGETRLRQNKVQEAEHQFRLAVASGGYWAVPYLNLARLVAARGEIDEVLAIYRAALEKQPENVALQLALAEAQQRSGDYAGARSTYEAIVETHADNAIAANNLAALLADHHYEDTASVKRALDLAQRFESSSNPYFVDTLGWVQFRLGDLPQARVNLERAVALLPNNPQLQYHLGMVLAHLGEHDDAVQALEKAVMDGADYPGLDNARSALADARRQKQENVIEEKRG